MGDDSWDDVAVRRHDRRLRALVADDDEGIRRLLTTVLELDGWDVRCATNGDEAVAMASDHPDAVLLDIMMPDSDGLSALRRIRANEANDGMRVVMVTALAEGDAQAEAEAAGADDYLVKPDAIDVVADRVLKLVRSAELPSNR